MVSTKTECCAFWSVLFPSRTVASWAVIVALVVSIFPTLSLEATEGNPETVGPQRIDHIEIEGRDWTEEFVIRRELLFEEGDTVTTEELEESVQRLRNLGLFRSVEYTLEPTPIRAATGSGPEGYRLRLVVDERWTLMPGFGINLGGGVLSYSVSASDINLLGRFLEVGALYYRFAETHSGAMWFYDPRFLDQRLLAGLQVRWTNVVRSFRDSLGRPEGGYLRTRRSFGALVQREFAARLSAGLSLSIGVDSYSMSYVPEAYAEAQRANGGLPASNLYIPLAANVIWGRVDSDSYLRDGQSLAVAVSHSDPVWGAGERVAKISATARWFRTLPWKSTFGVRGSLASTSASTHEHALSLGGLGGVRGLASSRYHGKYLWLGNAEFRIPSIDSRWFAMQHVVFLDAAGIDDRPSQFWDVRAASWGLGIRVLSPKIYSLLARVDYAFDLVGDGPYALSFGAGQYF